MRLKSRFIVLIFLISLCLTTGISFAEVSIPSTPADYVVDLAGIIDANIEAGLNRYLMELEQETSAQMVILTIKNLEGAPIEDLSITIAHDKWKLGQKGKDNGVLLLIALQDRQYRFEIGYGLEGLLPDSFVGGVGRQYIVPNFKQGDYSKGITSATLVVINKIATDMGVEITGMPKLRIRPSYPGNRMERKKPTLFGSILSILFFIGLIYLFIRHPRLLVFLLMFSMLSGGRRSGWGGGGGFGGGFGGGGGGGFGGGGASGGW